MSENHLNKAVTKELLQALLKLMSASNRMAKKDIYDLDFLTDEIPLDELMTLLEKKQTTFCSEQYK